MSVRAGRKMQSSLNNAFFSALGSGCGLREFSTSSSWSFSDIFVVFFSVWLVRSQVCLFRNRDGHRISGCQTTLWRWAKISTSAATFPARVINFPSERALALPSKPPGSLHCWLMGPGGPRGGQAVRPGECMVVRRECPRAEFPIWLLSPDAGAPLLTSLRGKPTMKTGQSQYLRRTRCPLAAVGGVSDGAGGEHRSTRKSEARAEELRLRL